MAIFDHSPEELCGAWISQLCSPSVFGHDQLLRGLMQADAQGV